ncbi:MAG: FAD-dependent oxidoreductase, partial [Rhodobacteraceae bacterium]|nr:FAD-dependent oxidoreductase [Paracoccaceae bacterium]
ACNQACLDHTFQGKISTCLVNPRACHETELVLATTNSPKTIAVVGSGPAGLSAALALDERGHEVTLFEKAAVIGGQLNLARQVPGKEEFHGLVAWFQTMLDRSNVTLRLGQAADVAALEGFDEIVVATGVLPRDPGIPGQDGENVMTYVDVLTGAQVAGRSAVVIGAGGIGFDVASYLVEEGQSATENLSEWLSQWGVADPEAVRGGLSDPVPEAPARAVTLLQRKPERPGRKLGKTTGWIHRAALQAKNVKMIGGVNYEKIDGKGLHVSFGPERKDPTVIEAESVILCAGQESDSGLAEALRRAGRQVHVIGGADVAAELDAKRAISQGTRLAAQL